MAASATAGKPSPAPRGHPLSPDARERGEDEGEPEAINRRSDPPLATGARPQAVYPPSASTISWGASSFSDACHASGKFSCVTLIVGTMVKGGASLPSTP